MFSKQPNASHQDDHDNQSLATIDRIHPVGREPLQTYEPPTIVNGSVIGSDLTILGENINIVSKESLQIDGEVHGDVSGKRVNIGVNGMVVGTISADSVEIDGGVQGTVRAQEVRLNAEAKVLGELIHQTLVVSQGAEFEGSVHRPKNNSELIPDLEGKRSDHVAKPPTKISSLKPASELPPDFYTDPLEAKPLEKPALHAQP
ncbi:MAG: polymer-forming cytoskeletal protein [bacterium]|nr:polymer-forming cytoskeletal protein [bacterium]